MLRPALFLLPAEAAHELTIRACQVLGTSREVGRTLDRHFGVDDDRLTVNVAGLRFRNPIGLAAGFDKNGRGTALLQHFGFGHLEIGSVSAEPSSGNPRPRLFRLPADRGVVVNYGVPNEGAATVARRLSGREHGIPIGVNLVKTNDRRPPSGECAVHDDYLRSLEQLAPIADYFMLNLSCPNSPDDRDFFDDVDRIHQLLAHLATAVSTPVFLKLKPSLDRAVLRDIVAAADDFTFVKGFAINLPSGKPDELALCTPRSELTKMPGAVAGAPVRSFVDAVLLVLAEAIGPRSRYRLVAGGGVFTAEDAYRKIRLGASLVQLYTALIYHGPRTVSEILQGLVALLERDGFTCLEEAVGADSGR